MLIAFVKKETDENIKLKIAFSLRKLLATIEEQSVAQSYNKIALTAYVRKATVSDIFSAILSFRL